MTAITDANTFIDQNLINVPYQGVPATTLNACLKTITNVFNSYATIASVNSLFGYALDGNFPAALMNAPNQAFTLNGGYVSISALLLFSSGQKYTVGPDGNYILNAANGPAWDWSTGRCRLLIEAIGSTNYWPYSEALEASYIGNQFSVVNTANSLFGTLNRATLTATTANAAVYSGYGYLPVVAGDVVTFTAAIENGSGQFVRGGLYGTASTWGADGDTTCVVLSGPGTVSRNGGGLWDFSGVTSDTVIRWTRTYQSAEYAVPFLYTNCAIGQTVSVGRIQLERGYGSSYTPTGASATDRPPDIVTAASGLLALMTAANCSVAFRGKQLTPGNGNLLGSTNQEKTFYDNGDGLSLDLYNALTGALPIASAGGGAVAYNIGGAFSYGQTMKIASSGGAVVSGAGVFLDSSDTGVRIGAGAYNVPVNVLLDELIVWPIFASDAGIQAQARVYP